MKRSLLAIMIVVAVLFALPSVAVASSKPTPQELASATAVYKKTLGLLLAGQVSRVYRYLYPAQKKLVDQKKFASCADPGTRGNLSQFKVVSASDSFGSVPGLNGVFNVITLVVKLTIDAGGHKTSGTVHGKLVIARNNAYPLLTQRVLDRCA